MHADAAEMAVRSAPDAPPIARGKQRLRTLARLDGRTIASKRARELLTAFAAELGSEITATQRLAIERAAALVALAEDSKARRLHGSQSISLHGVMLLNGAPTRAIKPLGLNRQRKPAHLPLPPSSLRSLQPRRRHDLVASAFRSPALFANAFEGGSWRAWRVVAKLLSGEDLDEAELDLFRRCTGRTRVPARAPKRLYMLVGRRSAKSRVAAAAAVHAAMSTDWREVMAPGEQAVALLLPSTNRGGDVRNYALGLIKASPMLRGEVVRETADEIELRNGAAIVIGTNDLRLIRGRSVIALVGDEACFWRSDGESASSDEEVVAAAEPGMAMTRAAG